MGATTDTRTDWRRWTTLAPPVAMGLLAVTWGRDPGTVIAVVVFAVLVASVLAAVHHAEVVAHKVGEPFGSLLLAVAVTVIEVALIITLMVSGSKDTSELARDTVFAAVMISVNGIVGISLVVGALKTKLAVFNAEGTGSSLATVITLATLTLVLPRFTTTEPGPEFSTSQLTFAAVASLAVYLMFVFTQTVQHRDFFLAVEGEEQGVPDDDEDGHADPPSRRTALVSLALLVVALVSVVGLAKVESPVIEDAVKAVGFPHAFVGVVIALLVLLPESISAVRSAARRKVQISLNLAYGSAMASIGLTIPTLAVATIWLDDPLTLGLGETQIVLLLMSVIVGVLTVVPGRSKPLNGYLHLAILAAYVFLSIKP